MGTMICSKCGMYGIYWKNLGGYNEHTFCPNCNGVNCQKYEEIEEDIVVTGDRKGET
jgi:hypothetical protein